MIKRINRKLTLEERISRLERTLTPNRRSRKFESFESDLDEEGARDAAQVLADAFAIKVAGVNKLTPVSKSRHPVVVDSPSYGWTDTSDLAEDPEARFAFPYDINNGEYTILVYPTEKAICLMTEDGTFIDPASKTFTSDYADTPRFPLNVWNGFDLSMIEPEEDDGYNIGIGDDLEDYYGESVRNRFRRARR